MHAANFIRGQSSSWSFASSAVLFQVKRVLMRNQKSVLYDHQKKSPLCLETCCLKNGQKTETDNSINFGLLGATFLFFRFPYVFVRCCIMQYCGKLCTFLAQIRLKRRRSGVIKRYVLEQWIKRRGILKLNQSVLYLDL